MAHKRSLSAPSNGFGNADTQKTRVGNNGLSFFVPVEQSLQGMEPEEYGNQRNQDNNPLNRYGPPVVKIYSSGTMGRREQQPTMGGVSGSGDWNPPPSTNWGRQSRQPEQQQHQQSFQHYQQQQQKQQHQSRQQYQGQQQQQQLYQNQRNSNYVPPPLKLSYASSESKRPRAQSRPPPAESHQHNNNNNNNKNSSSNNNDGSKSQAQQQPQPAVEPNFYNGYLNKGNNDSLMPKYSSAGPSLSRQSHGRTGVISQKARPVPGGYRGLDPNSTEVPKSSPTPVDEDGVRTFEEYQNEMKKQVVNKNQPAKKAFNLEDLPVNQLPCLVVLSVSIETMNRLMGRTPKTDVLFEFYGILDSPVNFLPALKAKKFTLRQGRSYINCMFFETDKPMGKVVRNHYMRCVGKWNMKLHAVVAYSARHAKQEEARKSAVRVEQHEPEVVKYFD